MENTAEVISDVKKRMETALGSLQHSLNGLRVGRASAALLDPVKVEVYGSMMQLNQLGTVSTPDPRTIQVQVWDKESTKHVEKAIREAGLGLNPIAEGTSIRIPIPELSEDRRKELVKKGHEYNEQSKIAIRNVRRDGMESLKKMEKNKLLSEDDLKHYSDEIQKITDNHTKKADEMLSSKSKEIMVV